MRPIDFVIFDGDSSPNMPAHEVAEAMLKNVLICGPEEVDYEVLSYYYYKGRMVLDIQPIDKK